MLLTSEPQKNKTNKQTKTIPDLEEKENRGEEKKIKTRNPLKFINGGGKKKIKKYGEGTQSI